MYKFKKSNNKIQMLLSDKVKIKTKVHNVNITKRSCIKIIVC